MSTILVSQTRPSGNGDARRWGPRGTFLTGDHGEHGDAPDSPVRLADERGVGP